jgi:CNT family concentrative nucleoside transporter
MLFIAWLLSSNRWRINLRIVMGGLLLQFVFAYFILGTKQGQDGLQWFGDVITEVILCADAGSEFLFNIYPKDSDAPLTPPPTLLRTFAFGVLPTIVFFSSLMSVLYYLGVMQRLVEVIAWVMQRTLGTSGAESLSAASNIFVGQTEAPLVVKPYLASMTLSELNAVMVGGFATIAGGVLAAFVSFGIDAGHLVVASVISAPAALVLAKILVPETEESQTMGTVKVQIKDTSVNVIEAAAVGASDGLKLALNVAAMLIAFLALIKLGNLVLGWSGQLFDQNWTIEAGLSFAFAPFAWLMGIPNQDCFRAGELLGMKMAANEFVAFGGLADWVNQGADGGPTERTQTIMTYALAGFANISSIGIQIGGIGAIAPERRSDLARLGFKAMVGGTLAAFMTACIAGILV